MTKPPGIRPVGRSLKVKMLIYGIPGAGKTRLVGSGPKTLILRPPTDHTDSIPATAKVDEWVLSDWGDMAEALEYLRHDRTADYDWVWLDSISLMQDYGLDNIWADVIARRPDRAQYGADKGEYGINMFRLGQWVRHMCGVNNFNFGITAHPFEVTDESGDPLIMPYVQGRNMAPKICGYMNVVGYLRVRKDTKTKSMYRELITEARGEPTVYAKDQFDAFNGSMRDPDMKKIMTAIESKRGASPAPAKRSVRRTAATRRKAANA